MSYPLGTQVGMQATALDRNYEMNCAQAPKPSGIASRISDLQQEVQGVAALAYQTKQALGITSPEAGGTKGPVQPSSLADVLTDLRIRLSQASSDLQDVIQHLNS